MQLDEEFLEEVGLAGMSEGKRAEFLEYAQGELEMRVGRKMSEGMSEAQLREFEGIARTGEGVRIREWIRANRPDYREVAMGELRALTEEMMRRREEILAGA